MRIRIHSPDRDADNNRDFFIIGRIPVPAARVSKQSAFGAVSAPTILQGSAPEDMHFNFVKTVNQMSEITVNVCKCRFYYTPTKYTWTVFTLLNCP